MFARLRAWWRNRKHTRPERAWDWCEECGSEDDLHYVTSGFDVDTSELGSFGGGAMTATYCVTHCPGGCDQVHRPKTYTPNPSNFEKKGGRPWGGGQTRKEVPR